MTPRPSRPAIGFEAVAMSPDQARSLIRLLTPLRGWSIPRSRVPGAPNPIPVTTVITALTQFTGMSSLDALVDQFNTVEDGDRGSLDPSGPAAALLEDKAAEDPFRQIEDRDEVNSYLEALNPGEAEVISVRFGLRTHDPKTRQEAAETLGLSMYAVDQIERRALAKLREAAGVASQREPSVPRDEISEEAAA